MVSSRVRNPLQNPFSKIFFPSYDILPTWCHPKFILLLPKLSPKYYMLPQYHMKYLLVQGYVAIVSVLFSIFLLNQANKPRISFLVLWELKALKQPSQNFCPKILKFLFFTVTFTWPSKIMLWKHFQNCIYSFRKNCEINLRICHTVPRVNP